MSSYIIEPRTYRPLKGGEGILRSMHIDIQAVTKNSTSGEVQFTNLHRRMRTNEMEAGRMLKSLLLQLQQASTAIRQSISGEGYFTVRSLQMLIVYCCVRWGCGQGSWSH